MYCKNCDYKNNDQAKFCAKCGQTLVDAIADNKKPNPVKRISWNRFIALISLVLVAEIAGATIFGLWPWNVETDKKVNAAKTENEGGLTEPFSEITEGDGTNNVISVDEYYNFEYAAVAPDKMSEFSISYIPANNLQDVESFSIPSIPSKYSEATLRSGQSQPREDNYFYRRFFVTFDYKEDNTGNFKFSNFMPCGGRSRWLDGANTGSHSYLQKEEDMWSISANGIEGQKNCTTAWVEFNENNIPILDFGNGCYAPAVAPYEIHDGFGYTDGKHLEVMNNSDAFVSVMDCDVTRIAWPMTDNQFHVTVAGDITVDSKLTEIIDANAPTSGILDTAGNVILTWLTESGTAVDITFDAATQQPIFVSITAAAGMEGSKLEETGKDLEVTDFTPDTVDEYYGITYAATAKDGMSAFDISMIPKDNPQDIDSFSIPSVPVKLGEAVFSSTQDKYLTNHWFSAGFYCNIAAELNAEQFYGFYPSGESRWLEGADEYESLHGYFIRNEEQSTWSISPEDQDACRTVWNELVANNIPISGEEGGYFTLAIAPYEIRDGHPTLSPELVTHLEITNNSGSFVSAMDCDVTQITWPMTNNHYPIIVAGNITRESKLSDIIDIDVPTYGTWDTEGNIVLTWRTESGTDVVITFDAVTQQPIAVSITAAVS